MPDTVFIALFCVLFALAVVWLATLVWLFRYLRLHHPPTYKAIGAPSLFWNNSPRNNWLFFKYLWSRHGRDSGDATLWNAVRFLRVFFVLYLVLFLVLIALFCSAMPRGR